MWRLSILLFGLPFMGTSCTVIDLPRSVTFKLSSVVLEGTVTDIYHFEPAELRADSSRTLVTFTVLRRLKGFPGSTIKIHAWERAMGCESAYNFEIGGRYLVYAIRADKEGGWADRYPKGTKILILNRATEDIEQEEKQLGKTRN
jgi:hypothetical protein